MSFDAQILLDVSAVHLKMRGRDILSDVHLRISSGEIVTLIGPNGAGKTTLLRIVLGLLSCDSGHLYQRAGLRIGYMPQRLQVDQTFPLSVQRFLGLGARVTTHEARGALEEVGGARLLDSPVHALSGGELQRVLLARALLRRPDLLVLDEPVQGVDVHGQAELYELITRIRDLRGCGVLMVSHDLHLVMASTDRVVCLNHHICCTGAPEVVTLAPEFVELFGPVVGHNLAIYTHNLAHRHLDDAGRTKEI